MSLYVPQLESDACGTGMVANLKARRRNDIVTRALTMLENMEHRGACGCEPGTGDGAGILVQIPREFFKKLADKGELNIDLPTDRNGVAGYGLGMIFFPKDDRQIAQCQEVIGRAADRLGFTILGYRQVPTDNAELGAGALSVEPEVQQLFVQFQKELAPRDLDRKLYVLRKLITTEIARQYAEIEDFYIVSLSCRTVIYKGQLTSTQVRGYYPDLSDPNFCTAVAMVHSRFATNTTPRWRLAQPLRYMAHNGEINTIQGNINWWRSRERSLESELFTQEELDIVLPVIESSGSDSAVFDNVLEFLVHAGRTLPEALMMMIPEAWQHDREIGQDKRDFYEYHEMLMEPWDGPAGICFTDGTLIGATLDRNGLRPSRYLVTRNHDLILASETGVIPVDPAEVLFKSRLEPGKILIADLEEGCIVEDEDLKRIICQRQDYNTWLAKHRKYIQDFPIKMPGEIKTQPLLQRQIAQGMTREDREVILRTMSKGAKEAIGSMGTDTPLAVLSRLAQHPANYFKQQFAQVTNPPIDPLRESEFMTLGGFLATNGNLLDKTTPQARGIRLDSPIIDVETYFRLRFNDDPYYRVRKIDCTFDFDYQSGDLEAALERICEEVEIAVAEGCSLLFLSNHHISAERVGVPSLLFTGAVHHRLVERGLRRKSALLVNASDCWETHHFATLLGYGADAVYPRVAFETIGELAAEQYSGPETLLFQKNYIRAVEKGLLKIMSKLGVSTLLSYKGAQTFEALGIHPEVIERCFRGTISRIGGMTFDMLAREALTRHHLAFHHKNQDSALPDTGVYQWKRRGEYHLFNPTSIHYLQQATRRNDYALYQKYSDEINRRERDLCTLRSLLEYDAGDRQPVPLEEVESEEAILKRFATGAMSFGSISHEAHTTLARAMNRIGGRSNSGEGGEDPSRFEPLPNGESMRSATKQVASGRFGVTSHYLSNADELQIKMAQGAKPGEGGQLPGHKVNDWIARVRNSTPGVGLISPPPHHDIYSIEDLAQLIYDLKNANRRANVSVKLVSKAGVGIIASGVAKGHADHLLISGHDGGTGASPVSSIRHCGLPWELGLAETHQTLVLNQLRNRVHLQVDGQVRTGRDLVIATLLGAEEWGIATAALVVEGCILMRKCHLNTCPVGIATQREDLRALYTGQVDHVVNYFKFLARDLRETMAALGFRTVNEMVGQSQLLRQRTEGVHAKAAAVDLSPVLYRAAPNGLPLYRSVAQDHGLERVMDRRLLQQARPALEFAAPTSGTFYIVNTDRATGTMLSNEVTRRYGAEGLPDGTIDFRFRGSAGQSFGAFSTRGLTFRLEGDANDYLGKGLSGARLVVVPDRRAQFRAEENIIVGNVCLYGATSGSVYIRGRAGERFAVRNSGAVAVVEGVGAHGCEYMTGGRVVVLGSIGRNFAAGMSGGVVYLLDPGEVLERYCNTEMVYLETPQEEDFKIIRRDLRQHLAYTGSRRALGILSHWETVVPRFVKVIPKEYKAVLARRAKEKELVVAV